MRTVRVAADPGTKIVGEKGQAPEIDSIPSCCDDVLRLVVPGLPAAIEPQLHAALLHWRSRTL